MTGGEEIVAKTTKASWLCFLTVSSSAGKKYLDFLSKALRNELSGRYAPSWSANDAAYRVTVSSELFVTLTIRRCWNQAARLPQKQEFWYWISKKPIRWDAAMIHNREYKTLK
jgi:hypothetical protein